MCSAKTEIVFAELEMASAKGETAFVEPKMVFAKGEIAVVEGEMVFAKGKMPIIFLITGLKSIDYEILRVHNGHCDTKIRNDGTRGNIMKL